MKPINKLKYQLSNLAKNLNFCKKKSYNVLNMTAEKIENLEWYARVEWKV
jgi:hypothetical protein